MRLIGALSHGSKVTPLHMISTLIDIWPSNGLTMNHLTLNKIWLLISLKKSLLLVITEGNSIFILSWETIGSGPIFSFFRDFRTTPRMHYSLLYTDPCLIQWIPKLEKILQSKKIWLKMDTIYIDSPFFSITIIKINYMKKYLTKIFW